MNEVVGFYIAIICALVLSISNTMSIYTLQHQINQLQLTKVDGWGNDPKRK